MQLIEAIAQVIEEAGWTEREAAWELDTHQPTVHWILQRKRFGVSLATLLTLWEGLGGRWELRLRR